MYKQVIDPRKFGKRENERIPIGSAKALFDGTLNGKHCFMICIRLQDLERSCVCSFIRLIVLSFIKLPNQISI